MGVGGLDSGGGGGGAACLGVVLSGAQRKLLVTKKKKIHLPFIQLLKIHPPALHTTAGVK